MIQTGGGSGKQKTNFQKFVSLLGQSSFQVTQFTPSGKGLVLVNEAPNMNNWVFDPETNTYNFNQEFPEGTEIIIYK